MAIFVADLHGRRRFQGIGTRNMMLNSLLETGDHRMAALGRWRHNTAERARCRIGIALGGGFARGIAHAGVLKVFEENRIPIHCIAGVSAGSMVAAAFASGTTADEIADAGRTMRFADVARWSVNRMGLAGSERMERFLKKLLRQFRFEDMRTPLGVLATDLSTGRPAAFAGRGDVMLPVRASCSYPGLFQPVSDGTRLLVDGAMSMEIPAGLCRQMGATHVVSVNLPMQGPRTAPTNMLQVVNRCFQIMQERQEAAWRASSDIVLSPDVRSMRWDAFESAGQLIEAGKRAAREALPHFEGWFGPERSR